MKKLISFMLAVAIIFSLSACSHNNDISPDNKKENIQTENAVIITESENTGIFKKSEIPQPSNIGIIRNICYIPESDRIFILGNNGICLTDSTFGVYNTISFDNKENDNVIFDCFSDKIFVVSEKNTYDSDIETVSQSFRISAYETDGTKISDADINNADFYNIDKIMYIDENKLLILCDSEKCFLMDFKGNITEKFDSDKSICDIVRLSDGRTAVCINADKGKDRELKSIDMDTMTFGNFTAALSDNLSGQLISGSGDYIAYIRNGSSVYGLKADNTAYKLMNMAESGITAVDCLMPLSDNTFIAVENGKLILLSERDISEISEIQELSLVVIGRNSSENSLEKNIADFNSHSNNYRIKVIDYMENQKYSLDGIDSATKTLEMDIALNKNFDMMFIEANEMQKMAARGIFADLYEFIENDKTYSKDTFLSNYLEASEINGHLYSISPIFQIKTCAAKKSNAYKRNWTTEEFMQAYEAMPDDMDLFESANHKSTVLYFITNEGMNFIDYENAECSFDSDEYIKLLEFADKFPSFDEYEWETKSCRNDTAMLSNMYIETFRDINVQKYKTFGEDIEFVGMPSDSGNGSAIILLNQLAIMKNSSNKEGCWEFIRTLFDDVLYYNHGIPVTKSGFEKVKSDALEMPYYINNEGIKGYTPEVTYDIFGTEIKVQPMTESDAEYYSDFIKSIRKSSAFHSETIVNKIIDEETEKFFAGGCTAKQCAEMIQSRISIYLKEQA